MCDWIGRNQKFDQSKLAKFNFIIYKYLWFKIVNNKIGINGWNAIGLGSWR